MLISGFSVHPKDVYMWMGCPGEANPEMSLFLRKQERRVGEPSSQDQTDMYVKSLDLVLQKRDK